MNISIPLVALLFETTSPASAITVLAPPEGEKAYLIAAQAKAIEDRFYQTPLAEMAP